MATLTPQVTVTNTGDVYQTVTANFARAANTTPYASGYLLSNANPPVPLPLAVSRVDAGSVLVDRIRIYKSGTSTTNASFRVHLFSALPVTAGGGDGAALSMTGIANYIGSGDVVVSQAFTDGASGFTDTTFKPIRTRIPAGYNLYALVEARAAYIPVSSEIFTVGLDVVQG